LVIILWSKLFVFLLTSLSWITYIWIFH
jgi:hypothetical protein